MKYSEKEKKLFETLNLNLFLHCAAPVIYEMAAKECFMENIQGPIADSVRNCIIALREGYPFRLTKEFDALIKLP